MKNQVYTGTPTSRRFALCPTTVKAGDPVFLGTIPAVALDDYSSLTGGTTFLTDGSFDLTVHGATVVSPLTGSAVKPGDKLYASGTLDATTNVTTGLTISKASGDTPFGELDPTDPGVGSGVTAIASVKLGMF